MNASKPELNPSAEARLVIIGYNHHNTLGLLRSCSMFLSKDMLYLVLINTPGSSDMLRFSNTLYQKNIFRIPDETEIAGALRQIPFEGPKNVIICAGDSAATETDRILKGELRNRFIAPNIHGLPGEIGRFENKERQFELAREAGLKLPLTLETSPRDDEFKSWSIFPAILKPVDSTEGSKNDIRIVETSLQLEEYMRKSTLRRVIIQEYIEKEMEFQLIGCSLEHGKILAIPGFSNIIRQPRNTNTGYLEFSYIGNLKTDMDKIEIFMRNLGYEGLFSLEFIKAKDGQDYFLEINMRNDGNAFCVTRYGINLPEIWYNYAVSGKIPGDFEPRKSVFFMPGCTDIRNILKVGPVKWIRQWVKADCHALSNRHDPRPFFLYLPVKVWKKILSRLH